MSLVPANPTGIVGIFQGYTGLRGHDDAADSKDAGGLYSHNSKEFSATEAESWCDLFRYMCGVLNSGIAGVPIYNDSGSDLTVGQLVYLSGWDAVNSKPTASLASSASLAGAQFVVSGTISNGTAGYVYKSLEVDNVPLLGSDAVGDILYLSTSTAGGLQRTKPASPLRWQEVGRVKTVGTTLTVIFNIKSPSGLLADISNIQGSPTGGDTIRYDVASSCWLYTA